MKKIKLREGIYTIVDDDDYERFKDIKWLLHNNGRGYYRAEYASKDGKRILHREIVNCPKGMFVDHINGDRLDNRKSNLRICTIQENSCNRKLNKNSSSGYKGVCYVNSKGGQWQAIIMVKQKNIYLGRYKTKEEAALAYNIKAKELFGEFARLNVIP